MYHYRQESGQGAGAQEGTQLGTLLWRHEETTQPPAQVQPGREQELSAQPRRALTTGPLFLGWAVDGAAASEHYQDKTGLATGPVLRAAL